MMNYPETLHYLYTRLPLFSRIGAAALKKDLYNTEELCEFLGNPEETIKTVHVGGTNGKGSVSHMLAAVLQTAGYKTGLYTSPHLKDFRERIKINGQMMPEAAVVEFVQRIQPQIEKLEPSFFEITVAMAFDFFAAEKVDIAIIEVGLGGRLDSTNVIVPELSVITNIGYDHMALLGDTLPKIASEKAGIIKEDVPVVIGERHPDTDMVFTEEATGQNAALFFAQDHFTVNEYQLQPNKLTVDLKEKDAEQLLSLQLDLPGLYQVKNLQTTLMALRLLQQEGWMVSDSHIVEGLRQVKQLTGLQGRWDVLRSAPQLVLEVAHNEDGMRQLLHHLQQQSFQNLHIVLGMVKDKDVAAVLQLLPTNAGYYFTQAKIPRAMEAQLLAEEAASLGISGAVYDEVNLAIEQAIQAAGPNDLVLVCGSVFLVGEVDRTRWEQ